MINMSVMLMLLLPLVLSVITFFIVYRFSDDKFLAAPFAFSGIGFLISALIIFTCVYAGKGVKTHDTEIWNGQVLTKSRIHGTYEESYECNCKMVWVGSGDKRRKEKQCDTCYRTHYTVKWDVNTTLGSYRVDYEDRLSRSVYDYPDPPKYARTVKGEACADTHSYVNYIKAVPSSLFRPSEKETQEKFAKMIPAYPIEIYDLWKVDRVLAMGVNVPDLKVWNDKLADMLKTVGPAKQANGIVVLVNTNDHNYMYALRDAWLNGKKNDAVLIIGTTKFPGKADWVEVLAMVENEIFKVQLRSEIMALDQLTADGVINTFSKNITTNFKRQSMKKFEYLEAEIDPPDWLIALPLAIILIGYIALWVVFIRNQRN